MTINSPRLLKAHKKCENVWFTINSNARQARTLSLASAHKVAVCNEHKSSSWLFSIFEVDDWQACSTSSAQRNAQHSTEPSGLCISSIRSSFIVSWTKVKQRWASWKEEQFFDVYSFELTRIFEYKPDAFSKENRIYYITITITTIYRYYFQKKNNTFLYSIYSFLRYIVEWNQKQYWLPRVCSVRAAWRTVFQTSSSWDPATRLCTQLLKLSFDNLCCCWDWHPSSCSRDSGMTSATLGYLGIDEY